MHGSVRPGRAVCWEAALRPVLFFLSRSPRARDGCSRVFLGPPSLALESQFPEPALTPGTHLPGSKRPCQPGLIKDGESLAAAPRLHKGHLSAVRAPAGLIVTAQPYRVLATLCPLVQNPSPDPQ